MARRSLSERVQELEHTVEVMAGQLLTLLDTQSAMPWSPPVERKKTYPNFTCGCGSVPVTTTGNARIEPDPDQVMCEGQVEDCPRRPQLDSFRELGSPPDVFRNQGLM